MKVKVSDIKLYGNPGATIASQTGLSPETELEFLERRASRIEMGAKDVLYRIVGNLNDALVIHRNYWLLPDWAELKMGFFSDRRAYAQRVGKLSKKYGIRFDVCLALGDQQVIYDDLQKILSDEERLREIPEELVDDLYFGIRRRKNGLYAVLGEELYQVLKIEEMGQVHSERLALYVAKRIEQANPSNEEGVS